MFPIFLFTSLGSDGYDMAVAKWGSLANVGNAVIHLGMNKKVFNTSLPFQILCLLLTNKYPSLVGFGSVPLLLSFTLLIVPL